MGSEDKSNLDLDKKLYEIMAGKIECVVLGQSYYIFSATPSLKISAQNLYNNIFTDLQYAGLLTSDEFLDIMLNNGWWTIKENNELNSLNTIIDNLKLEMYNKYCSFQSKQVEKVRVTLKEKRNRYIYLFNKRHSNDYFTCEGQASLERARFLVSNCILYNDNKFIPQDDWTLSKITELYMLNKPSEIDIRHIANLDNWRSIWTCGKISDVFGIPAVLLSDEQKSLVGWSKLYDNIYEHPQSPAKEVIQDDDLLDGWLIAEQNKRMSEKNNNNNNTNKNMADEVYIPAETANDASRITGQNSIEAKLIQQQRLHVLKKKGIIADHKMPDMKLKIIEQQRQMNKTRK